MGDSEAYGDLDAGTPGGQTADNLEKEAREVRAVSTITRDAPDPNMNHLNSHIKNVDPMKAHLNAHAAKFRAGKR